MSEEIEEIMNSLMGYNNDRFESEEEIREYFSPDNIESMFPGEEIPSSDILNQIIQIQIEKLESVEGKRMKIINLTPHTLSLYRDGVKIMEIPSSGIVRAEEISQRVEGCPYDENPCSNDCWACSESFQKMIMGIPVVRKSFGKVTGLPESKEGTFYFVSRIILEACPDRKDLITSSKLVRDQNGRIIGCEEFTIL